MTKLTIMELPVGALKDYANNSKEHDRANVDAIKASIEAFGMCDPVGVWRNADGEYEIVEGHGRKMALQEMGRETVPCIDLSHLTDEERRVYSHVHNQTALMGELDLEIAELDFDGTEFDMETFGFDALEIADAISYEETGALSKEDIEAYAAAADSACLKAYNVVICCLDDDQREFVARLLGESDPDDLRRMYRAKELMERL